MWENPLVIHCPKERLSQMMYRSFPTSMESSTATNSSFPAKLLLVTTNDFAVQAEMVAVETSIDVGNILLASCPWGPVIVSGVDLLTKIYVIYMQMHTSHRAIARCFGPGLFNIWHLASHPGNLPILGRLSRRGFLPFSNFWHVAKISWHAANSAPSDSPWS